MTQDEIERVAKRYLALLSESASARDDWKDCKGDVDCIARAIASGLNLDETPTSDDVQAMSDYTTEQLKPQLEELVDDFPFLSPAVNHLV